mmetsp:Transcript_23143/g.66425  ORF Transcript_23143/g.66425 Transcript_23143/m.66425 type:complete len:229 (-) Transcript_23143:8-694(-)
MEQFGESQFHSAYSALPSGDNALPKATNAWPAGHRPTSCLAPDRREAPASNWPAKAWEQDWRGVVCRWRACNCCGGLGPDGGAGSRLPAVPRVCCVGCRGAAATASALSLKAAAAVAAAVAMAGPGAQVPSGLDLCGCSDRSRRQAAAAEPTSRPQSLASPWLSSPSSYDGVCNMGSLMDRRNRCACGTNPLFIDSMLRPPAISKAAVAAVRAFSASRRRASSCSFKL